MSLGQHVPGRRTRGLVCGGAVEVFGSEVQHPSGKRRQIGSRADERARGTPGFRLEDGVACLDWPEGLGEGAELGTPAHLELHSAGYVRGAAGMSGAHYEHESSLRPTLVDHHRDDGHAHTRRVRRGDARPCDGRRATQTYRR